MIEKGVFIAPVPLGLVGLWTTVLFWPNSISFLGLTITPWTILTIVALAFYVYKSIPSSMNLAPLVEAELTRLRQHSQPQHQPELSTAHLFPISAPNAVRSPPRIFPRARPNSRTRKLILPHFPLTGTRNLTRRAENGPISGSGSENATFSPRCIFTPRQMENSFFLTYIHQESRPPSKDIRVLTYNLYLRPPLINSNGNDWKNERLHEFIKLLPEYDVVCLQEVFALGSRRQDNLVKAARQQGFHVVKCIPPPFLSLKFIDAGVLILSRFPVGTVFLPSSCEN
jgi:hypothetical protein